jgi:Zn-finger nucleic acid-binding protein
MQCPKCQHLMKAVTVQEITVHRCIDCHGLWFDVADHESLREAAVEIDIGDPAYAAHHVEQSRVHCPTCANSTMIAMVDAAQPHIRFESCTVCFGRYYDAGEFRDFAEYGLEEFLQNLFAPARA